MHRIPDVVNQNQPPAKAIPRVDYVTLPEIITPSNRAAVVRVMGRRRSGFGTGLLAILLCDIALIGPAASQSVLNSPVMVTVDANASRKAISPLIYGVNYATPTALADLNVP